VVGGLLGVIVPIGEAEAVAVGVAVTEGVSVVAGAFIGKALFISAGVEASVMAVSYPDVLANAAVGTSALNNTTAMSITRSAISILGLIVDMIPPRLCCYQNWS
jgi:hypothetical protein